MSTFPLPLQDIFGHWGAYAVYFLIGIAFGYILEIAGFGKSTKLAAQFYLKEMSVLKVMFSAIVVAMVLIFLASGIGLLDFNRLWVNQTYLLPGIVGGLIMGFGFIIGGFCPGTSLVAAATFKLDGIVFVLGALFGMFAFGATIGFYDDFWTSSYMGRFTLPELFNLDTGLVVIGIVIVALAAFALAELAERRFGRPPLSKSPKWRFGVAGTLVIVSLATLVFGEPTNTARWSNLPPEAESLLTERAVYAHPGELLQYMHDSEAATYMIDVRSETDYAQFHILNAHYVPMENLVEAVPVLRSQPENTVYFVMSNDETAAAQAWRILTAENITNAYILSGGVNRWLDTFSEFDFQMTYRLASHADDQLGYRFDTGTDHNAARPNPETFHLNFEPVVQPQTSGVPASTGGCG
jgi:rhodanese-related sulfurtransferase